LGVVCTDNSGNNLDVCDGADNDCNPLTADGAADPQVGISCDGSDSDLCIEGVSSCVSGSILCEDFTASTIDVCDGSDNDCDPISADGSEDPLVGLSCDGPDTDLCDEGTNSCAAGTIVCSDTSGNTLDLCNGNTNDDCNSATPDGADEPNLGNPCDGPDSDLCQEGSYYCSGVGGMVCDDSTGDNLEVCDNMDNDCDGVIDEGGVCFLSNGEVCTTDSQCQSAFCECADATCLLRICNSVYCSCTINNDADGLCDDGYISFGYDASSDTCGHTTCDGAGGCIYSCFGITYNNPSVCSGHGNCVSTDTCICDSGWIGADCSTSSP
jgi:hypothetical protein